MSATDNLVTANESYVAAFRGARPRSPKLCMAIVECMDTRLDTFGALGLDIGDAHIIRNAGGLVTIDVLRSLAISQHDLGTREVVVLHHTDCGMTGFDDVAFRARLERESGERPTWDVPGFTDVERQLAESITRIRTCEWLPHRDDVRGFVYDVSTARITEVDTAGGARPA